MKTRLIKLDLETATVVKRVSRVSVLCEKEGVEALFHMTNTGRLLELIYPGATVYVYKRKGVKTDGVVVGVDTRDGPALIDTRTQSRCFELACERGLVPWLQPYKIVGREVKIGGSRIDYLIEAGSDAKGLMELKSAVYLDSDGAAMYPDTVSLRGRDHIMLLTGLPRKLRRIITFIAAHPAAKYFRPCDEADPMISRLLKAAVEGGVELRSVKICLRDGAVYLEDWDLPIRL